jgi:catechol 2,3-dioxygenase-like lactoylglutathione lyase family enzyme
VPIELKPPFRIAAIDHIVLRAREPSRIVAFYRDVLGCRVERHQPDIDLTQLRAGRSLIDVVPAPHAAPAGPGRLDHFCLTIEPFDEAALRTYLGSQGVRAGESAPRYGAEGEGLSLYIEDPEGNRVELKQARLS